MKPPASGGARRILFIAEAVSLAHVGRPAILAKSLAKAGYEVHFASEKRYPLDFGGTSVRLWPIKSITPEQFLSALANGRPLYTEETLGQYIREDLALMDVVRPDIVVGDFRLSLAVSARLRRVHYVSITNAYWSPYSPLERLPFPEHRLGALIGVPLASSLFKLLQPLILAPHTWPLNRLRRAYGQPALCGLREIYTAADTTVYADVPELAPLRDPPSHHRYIGPLLWSPDVPLPSWWDEISAQQPCIYVTLGSSGQLAALSAVLEGLAPLPVSILLATAGRKLSGRCPPNVRFSDYLPGMEAARRSTLVVCNGGSATAYQALACGKPVLGIPSNVDQHLAMGLTIKAGAGVMIRAEQANPVSIRDAARRLLGDPAFTANAAKVARWFAAYPAERLFRETIAQIEKKGG